MYLFHFFTPDGVLLKEVDRMLRPKGYFVYSAPPAYRSDKDFPHEWSLIMNYTTSMCWKLIAREVQTAIWQKTSDRACLLDHGKDLVSLCHANNNPDKSWNKKIQNCIYFDSEDVNSCLINFSYIANIT